MLRELNVREATLKDLSSIQDLNQLLFTEDAGKRDSYVNPEWVYQKEGKEYFEKFLSDKNHVCFIAEDNDRIIGYLAGYILSVDQWRPIKKSELDSMYVKEGWKNKGIGTMLVKTFIEWSKKNGVARIHVSAYTSNEKAKQFYTRIGFTPFMSSYELPVG